MGTSGRRFRISPRFAGPSDPVRLHGAMVAVHSQTASPATLNSAATHKQNKSQRQKAPSSPAAESAWNEISSRVARSLPESTFRMWLAPLEPIAIRGTTLYLDAPETVRSWVGRRYQGLIERALEDSPGGVTGISFDTPAPSARTDSVVGAGHGANPTHTFDRFVIGPGNHLAHAAALAVAESPSEAYNPLFIHGAPGLGKTHLLGAIANYLEQHVPDLTVLYTNAEAFTAEFIGSMRKGNTEEFKRRYRDIDVLLIDDIQFIAGKSATEQEFFHTFNALHQSGSQIVLCADRSPAEITSLTDRLSDRFEWGLTVPVQSPNLATRLTVLRHLVTEAGLEITDQEALTLLARRVQTNLRQLHGALTRSIAESSLNSMPITADLVGAIFPEATPAASVTVTPELIRELTAAHFRVDVESLVSRKRDKNTARARHISIYLTREMTDLSLPQIGGLYGDRDHSPVLNSLEHVSTRVNVDPEITTAVEKIRASVHTGTA